MLKQVKRWEDCRDAIQAFKFRVKKRKMLEARRKREQR